MKKIMSLIKASMTENMSLFKIKNKNQSDKTKKLLPIMLAILVFGSIWSYANIFMEPLEEMHVEYILLTLFVAITSLLTLVEGIYKSGSLLFDCKDDNMLLSLPIKKSTVLFIRIFKFYVFELLYNSLFLVPAMVVYATKVNVDISFYIVSVIAVLLLPIFPIVISCLIGFITTLFSSGFKYKNIVQIIVTTLILLVTMYLSYNFKEMIENLAQNAESINELITKIYYPAGAYIKLVTNFNIQDLLIFIAIHIAVVAVSIFIMSKVYFKINSKNKIIKKGTKNSNYKIKTNKPLKSLIKKELGKFINTPVFVINAGFGLVLFIVGCVLVCMNFEGIAGQIANQEIGLTIENLREYTPVVLFVLIVFASFMSSITSSMISLEGKTFNMLKSLPIKPFTIITSKIYAAVLIMIPFILIGDLIFFVRFNFNIVEIVLTLLVSIILPLISETVGILINLKYPKLDAENDTEVVKQSMSSMVAVFAGMILTGIFSFLLAIGVIMKLPTDLYILGALIVFLLIYLMLDLYLSKRSVKEFNKINV